MTMETNFAEAVLGIDPAETLFIFSSKRFTSLENMTNALIWQYRKFKKTCQAP